MNFNRKQFTDFSQCQMFNIGEGEIAIFYKTEVLKCRQNNTALAGAYDKKPCMLFINNSITNKRSKQEPLKFGSGYEKSADESLASLHSRNG